MGKFKTVDMEKVRYYALSLQGISSCEYVIREDKCNRGYPLYNLIIRDNDNRRFGFAASFLEIDYYKMKKYLIEFSYNSQLFICNSDFCKNNNIKND